MSRRYRYSDGPMVGTNPEFDDIWRHLDALEKPQSQSIEAKVGLSETEVRHNLGRIPKHVSPVPRADARVWVTRKTDSAIFLQASAAVTVDVKVE